MPQARACEAVRNPIQPVCACLRLFARSKAGKPDRESCLRPDFPCEQPWGILRAEWAILLIPMLSGVANSCPAMVPACICTADRSHQSDVLRPSRFYMPILDRHRLWRYLPEGPASHMFGSAGDDAQVTTLHGAESTPKRSRCRLCRLHANLPEGRENALPSGYCFLPRST